MGWVNKVKQEENFQDQVQKKDQQESKEKSSSLQKSISSVFEGLVQRQKQGFNKKVFINHQRVWNNCIQIEILKQAFQNKESDQNRQTLENFFFKQELFQTEDEVLKNDLLEDVELLLDKEVSFLEEEVKKGFQVLIFLQGRLDDLQKNVDESYYQRGKKFNLGDLIIIQDSENLKKYQSISVIKISESLYRRFVENQRIGQVNENDKTILVFLKQNKLFQGTPFSCIKSCLKHFEELKFPPKKVIFNRGAQTDGIYFILEGQVEVYSYLEAKKSEFILGSEEENFEVKKEIKKYLDYFGNEEIIQEKETREKVAVAGLEEVKVLFLEKTNIFKYFKFIGLVKNLQIEKLITQNEKKRSSHLENQNYNQNQNENSQTIIQKIINSKKTRLKINTKINLNQNENSGNNLGSAASSPRIYPFKQSQINLKIKNSFSENQSPVLENKLRKNKETLSPLKNKKTPASNNSQSPQHFRISIFNNNKTNSQEKNLLEQNQFQTLQTHLSTYENCSTQILNTKNQIFTEQEMEYGIEIKNKGKIKVSELKQNNFQQSSFVTPEKRNLSSLENVEKNRNKALLNLKRKKQSSLHNNKNETENKLKHNESEILLANIKGDKVTDSQLSIILNQVLHSEKETKFNFILPETNKNLKREGMLTRMFKRDKQNNVFDNKQTLNELKKFQNGKQRTKSDRFIPINPEFKFGYNIYSSQLI